jgi:hypothetical protein
METDTNNIGTNTKDRATTTAKSVTVNPHIVGLV